MIIILFGVTGAGKTVVGRTLAQELGWSFYDADEFHYPHSVEKMRRGVPLTDADRWPWLDRLRELIERCLAAGENAVLACSALKTAYRRHLAISGDVKLVYLKAGHALIAQRLRDRHEHFMNPKLLQSQFDTLEEPHGQTAVVVDASQTVPHVVRAIRMELQL